MTEIHLELPKLFYIGINGKLFYRGLNTNGDTHREKEINNPLGRFLLKVGLFLLLLVGLVITGVAIVIASVVAAVLHIFLRLFHRKGFSWQDDVFNSGNWKGAFNAA